MLIFQTTNGIVTLFEVDLGATNKLEAQANL